MSTELLLVAIFIVEFVAILTLSKFPIRFVCATIAINLLLIATFGQTLINIFGFTTNLGNVFYVAITFTFYILLDKYGRRVPYATIWSSLFLVLFFIFVAKLAVLIQGAPMSPSLLSPRLIVASLLAFVAAQHCNLYVYERLFMRFGESKLWLRLNVSNLATQIVDSLIFFPFAFYGMSGGASLWEITFVGLGLKIITGLGATALLHIDRTLFAHSRPRTSVEI
ncbi:MAG TPA: queuosine precursor transporter [Candidatus Paceibacterota bacterium]